MAELQAFKFKVICKKGSLHVDADCMSRLIDVADSAQEDTDTGLHLEAFLLIRHLTTQSSQNEQERNKTPEIQTIDEIDDRTVDIRIEQ